MMALKANFLVKLFTDKQAQPALTAHHKLLAFSWLMDNMTALMNVKLVNDNELYRYSLH